MNTNDVNLHIRLVKLYCQSGESVISFFSSLTINSIGKSQEAFYYCEDLYRAGQLTDSLQWQLFALTIAEVPLPSVARVFVLSLVSSFCIHCSVGLL